MKKIYQCLFILAPFAVSVSAQSGGTFTITQSVVASGGGQSSGGTFNATGTSGQSVAGTSSTGGTFNTSGGFWHAALAPTAAGVSVTGRVLTPDGRGLRNATVSMTDQQGVPRYARTSSFGYYRFEDVIVGGTYILAVTSKRYQFASQVVNVTDDLTDVDFVAQELDRIKSGKASRHLDAEPFGLPGP